MTLMLLFTVYIDDIAVTPTMKALRFSNKKKLADQVHFSLYEKKFKLTTKVPENVWKKLMEEADLAERNDVVTNFFEV